MCFSVCKCGPVLSSFYIDCASEESNSHHERTNDHCSSERHSVLTHSLIQSLKLKCVLFLLQYFLLSWLNIQLSIAKPFCRLQILWLIGAIKTVPSSSVAGLSVCLTNYSYGLSIWETCLTTTIGAQYISGYFVLCSPQKYTCYNLKVKQIRINLISI